MFLDESQTRLTVIALAGALFQILALYAFRTFYKSSSPLPDPTLYLFYFPLTVGSYIYYYKIFT